MSLNLTQRFYALSIVERLIVINVLCFVLPAFLKVVFYLFDASQVDYLSYFNLPSSINRFLNQPWSILTYSFLHGGILHLLFNMLVLYYVGKMFVSFLGSKKFFSTYFLGVLAGGVAFMISYNLFPVFSSVVEVSDLVGASAGIMSILFFMCGYAPKMRINFFLFSIPFYVLGLALVMIDLITLPLNDNAGGNIAHLGGAAIGFYSVYRYKSGKVFGDEFEEFMGKIVRSFKPKQKNASHRQTKTKDAHRSSRESKKEQKSQEKIEKILKKISESGYQSLTQDEKEFLFNKDE